jgi:hypothetical protein
LAGRPPLSIDDARWECPPVAAPAAEERCVFQEVDQTMPRCCFCWFLQLNASHEAKDAPLQVQN